jgi:hypothetical protein
VPLLDLWKNRQLKAESRWSVAEIAEQNKERQKESRLKTLCRKQCETSESSIETTRRELF